MRGAVKAYAAAQENAKFSGLHAPQPDYPWGFAPRTPLHALSLGAAPPRSVRVASFAELTRAADPTRTAHDERSAGASARRIPGRDRSDEYAAPSSSCFCCRAPVVGVRLRPSTCRHAGNRCLQASRLECPIEARCVQGEPLRQGSAWACPPLAGYSGQ